MIHIVIIPVTAQGAPNGTNQLLTGVIFAPRMFACHSRLQKFPAVWLCAFGGLVAGASVGNFFSLVLFRQPKEFWAALTVVAPIERAVFASGAMFVGVPLLAGLNKIGVLAGPWVKEEN